MMCLGLFISDESEDLCIAGMLEDEEDEDSGLGGGF